MNYIRMPRSPDSIGFPPPLLGPAPLRLAILHAGNGLVALEKPANTSWERDKFTDVEDICGAFRAQLARAKPEITQLGLTDPASVWPVEKEMPGVGLLAERGPVHQHWRNAFGSACFRFCYEFLATGGPSDEIVECALPLAEHFSEPRALVSHATGKKSSTIFRRIAKAGRWNWWEAVTDYPRWHQIRLHAAEVGLTIVGETLYATGDSIMLSHVMSGKRLNKGDDRPLHDGMCLRMAAVDCSRAEVDGLKIITAPEPAKWSVLRKRLASLNS